MAVEYLITGDFDPEISSHPEHQVCVANMVDFTSAFLFSVETQHTIGYVAPLIINVGRALFFADMV